MSPSARMTAASGIERQLATWPFCARSPLTSWAGTEHPGSACGRGASRPPGTMSTCSLFWLADFMRRPWDAPETLINRLIEPDDQVFADEDAWTNHLIALGITGAKAVRLASVVAGSLDHLLPDAVIVSDGAGQFDVLRHGLCWIHAERLIHRLVTVTEEQRAAVALVRHLIWWFYRSFTGPILQLAPGPA